MARLLRNRKEVVELVRSLAVDGRLDDTQIARVLIQRNMRTATGLTFTKTTRAVGSHSVPNRSRDGPSGWWWAVVNDGAGSG